MPSFLSLSHHPSSTDFAASSWLCAALAIALWALFRVYPELDLVVTGWFYQDGFAGREYWLARLVYDSVYLAFTAALALLAWSAWQASRKRASWRVFAFLSLGLLLVPGVLVNWVFKELSGRARPDAVLQFGGDRLFTEPWQWADQCATNCSFVSGHAGMGFYFVALAFVLATGRRHYYQLLACGWALGLFFGFFRIYQGRHFLSDVLWSGLAVTCAIHLLYWLLLGRQARTTPTA